MEPGTIWQPFPLAPFLLALRAEGFRLTVRGYEGIALVLRANGPWTVRRLRDALRALLARTADRGPGGSARSQDIEGLTQPL